MKADDLLMCDCAGCGTDLLGESMRIHYAIVGFDKAPHPFVRGRIYGRPYCGECLTVRRPPAGLGTPEDDGAPWQQNAIRAMEDAE